MIRDAILNKMFPGRVPARVKGKVYGVAVGPAVLCGLGTVALAGGREVEVAEL